MKHKGQIKLTNEKVRNKVFIAKIKHYEILKVLILLLF